MSERYSHLLPHVFSLSFFSQELPAYGRRSPYAAGLPTADGACTNVAVVDARRRGSAVLTRKGLEVRNGQSSMACRRRRRAAAWQDYKGGRYLKYRPPPALL